MAADRRLAAQLQFLLEIDKLKQVARRTLIADGSRRENDAEHSWHITVMAIVLAEYAPPGTDIAKVVRMLLVHDLVEIYAGDTYCYDAAAVCNQAERERQAADRLFALLPPDQSQSVRNLWEEFEAKQTPEARFAAALDRVQPVLLNYHTQGKAWREHGVTKAQVIARNRHIESGSPLLWDYIRTLIDDAVARDFLAP